MPDRSRHAMHGYRLTVIQIAADGVGYTLTHEQKRTLLALLTNVTVTHTLSEVFTRIMLVRMA